MITKENLEWFREKKFKFKDPNISYDDEVLKIVGWYYEDDCLYWMCLNDKNETVERRDKHWILEYIPS